MFGWILKMLLKVFKPFAKMMILEAIMGSLTDMLLEEEEASEEDTDAADGE